MTAQQASCSSSAWSARCRACGAAETVDLVLPIEIQTGPTCRTCDSVEMTVTGHKLTIIFSRPLPPLPIKGWQCCHCGGGGLDSYGDPCEHCEGLGTC
jgi:hypothetical protein